MDTTNSTVIASQDSQDGSSGADILTIALVVFGIILSIGLFASCMFTCAGYHRYQLGARNRMRNAQAVSLGPWIFNFGRRTEPAIPSSPDASIIGALRYIENFTRDNKSSMANYSTPKAATSDDKLNIESELKEGRAYEEQIMFRQKQSIIMDKERMKSNMTDRLKNVGQPFAGGDELTCKICFSRKCEVFLEPCGHVGICEPCAIKIFDEKKKCPFDQEPVTAYRIAYVV